MNVTVSLPFSVWQPGAPMAAWAPEVPAKAWQAQVLGGMLNVLIVTGPAIQDEGGSAILDEGGGNIETEGY